MFVELGRVHKVAQTIAIRTVGVSILVSTVFEAEIGVHIEEKCVEVAMR
jgi:hypothetical protein